LVVAAVASLALAAAGVSVGAPVKGQGVTWAGIHFADPAALSAWLGGRGVTYRDWASRHPRGVFLMTHPRPKPAQPATLPATAAAPEGRSVPASEFVMILFLAASIFLAGTAANAPRIIHLVQLRSDGRRVRSMCVAGSVGAAAVAVGSFVAWLV
jgi:hypothetical protein